MAWTEPLFIALVIAFLWVLERSPERLVLLIALAAAASLTRYLGVALIAVGFLAMRRNRFTFATLASLPLCLWLAHNYIVSGTLAGTREPSSYTLVQNLTYTSATFADWLRPVLLFTLVLILFAFRRVDWLALVSRLSAPLLFIAIYTALLIATSTLAHYDQIGNRLLSPIYAPAVLVILSVADACIGTIKRSALLDAALLTSVAVVSAWFVLAFFGLAT